MDDGVEVFMPDGGEITKSNSPVGAAGITFTAVNRYRVSSLRQTYAQLFGECFETPVVGWNPARAENCDAWLDYELLISASLPWSATTRQPLSSERACSLGCN